MCGFCFLKSCFVPSKSITCPVVHVAVLENFSEDTMKETSGGLADFVNFQCPF